MIHLSRRTKVDHPHRSVRGTMLVGPVLIAVHKLRGEVRYNTFSRYNSVCNVCRNI